MSIRYLAVVLWRPLRMTETRIGATQCADDGLGFQYLQEAHTEYFACTRFRGASMDQSGNP
jgi:hypothetical protein